ncbi:MAG TPA: hypothetical protein PLJ90_03220 [Candidatus Cloacimonas sp.]|jgi:hypothetical protein|nr:hypothetical protein [Candidatus Cloacimonas sp.]
MDNTKVKEVPSKPKCREKLKEKETTAAFEVTSSNHTGKTKTAKKSKIRRKTNIRPIILLITFCLFFSFSRVAAQITGSVKVEAVYSDNSFHLSEYDIDRFNDGHPNLEFVDTIDDLTLKTRIELQYPFSYRWWKFTPSVTGNFAQNISNEDKYRTDWALKFKVYRYYWNCSIQYTSNPYIYFRQFVDSDGTGELEKYCYSRDTYRGDIAIKPLPKTIVKANLRYELYRYNEYFTEGDGTAITGEAGISYKFPFFTVEGSYGYQDFSCDKRLENKDCSYQSNIYKGALTLPKMPLSEKGKTFWQPSFALNYEQRFYQGSGSWYGGRAYYTYNLSAGCDVFFSPQWNLSLDYSHYFRNVETDNESVQRLKEYGENRISTALRYKF